MNQILLTLVISYLLMSCYFFVNWLDFRRNNPTSSPEDRLLSWIISAIATIFWPLIIPISCIQMLKEGNLELSKVIPVILGIFAVGISFYVSQFE